MSIRSIVAVLAPGTSRAALYRDRSARSIVVSSTPMLPNVSQMGLFHLILFKVFPANDHHILDLAST